MEDYFKCSVCGTKLPMEADYCPECYADAETGWSEDAKYDGLLPLDTDEEPIPKSIYPANSLSKIIYASVAIFTVVSFLLFAVNGNPIMIPIALGLIALAYFWSK